MINELRRRIREIGEGGDVGGGRGRNVGKEGEEREREGGDEGR